MPRRFTDTEKWKDEWFLSLPNDYRIVWQYIVDNCTQSGILKKNFKLLNFCCNTELSVDNFLEVFKNRVLDMPNFFFIPKFLKYQYPKGLNSDKPAIISVKNDLISLGLVEIVQKEFGNDYLIIKDKDKYKDKDKGSTAPIKKLKKWKCWHCNNFFSEENRMRHLKSHESEVLNARP